MIFKSFILCTTVLSSLSTITHALPSSKVDIRAAYEIKSVGEIMFKGPISAGGPEVELNGSAKSIYDQIKAMNPNFDNEFENHTSSALRPRQIRHPDWEAWPPLCNVFSKTYQPFVLEGANYLYSLGTQAQCGAAPGPGHWESGRISCSYNSGIYYCNDKYVAQWTACWVVADYVLDLTAHCVDPIGNVRGQLFDAHADFNIVVTDTWYFHEKC